MYKVINNYKICLSYYAYLKFSNKKFRLWRPIPESEPEHYVKLCLRYAYFLPKNEARYAYKQYAYKNKTCTRDAREIRPSAISEMDLWFSFKPASKSALQ